VLKGEEEENADCQWGLEGLQAVRMTANLFIFVQLEKHRESSIDGGERGERVREVAVRCRIMFVI